MWGTVGRGQEGGWDLGSRQEVSLLNWAAVWEHGAVVALAMCVG